MEIIKLYNNLLLEKVNFKQKIRYCLNKTIKI